MTVGGYASIGFGEGRLRFHRALDGIDGAAKLRQHAVPGCIGDPAAVGSDQTVKDTAPMG